MSTNSNSRNPRGNRSNQRRNQPAQRRRGGGNQPDVWRAGGPLPDVEPIVVSDDVGALIRSLGEPPLAGATSAAASFETVAERAAYLAAVLARVGGVHAEPDDD
jgi:hypothetical protein